MAFLVVASPLSATANTFVYEVATTRLDAEGKDIGLKPHLGTWTISFDGSIFRVDAEVPLAGSTASVPFSESLESGAHLSRLAGQELKVGPMEPLSRMQADADALLLVGRFPGGGKATSLDVRRDSLFPGAVEQVALREVDGALIPVKAVLLYGERPGGSWIYASSGPRDSTGPLPGYKATIERRWSDGRLVSIQEFTLKARNDSPPVSLTQALSVGDKIIDLRLGENRQRSYTWSGKLPSLAELKAMGSGAVSVPSGHMGQTVAVWSSVCLLLLGTLLFLGVARRRQTPGPPTPQA